MPRPHISLQIDKLEAEFERAREEGDAKALKLLQAELTQRRQTTRVIRLTTLIAEAHRVEPEHDRLAPIAPAAPTTGPHDAAAGGTARPGAGTNRQRPPRALQAGAPRFKPTPEQEAAVELFRTGDNLKINAYAGTGKTSTLQLLAHSTRAKGQYLAFNRRIVFDSRERFPRDVNCATTHSVAYRSLIGRYSREQMTDYLSANQLAEVLQLKNWRIDRNHVLAPRSQAYLILSTIRRYCQSDKREFIPEHVPRHGSLASAPQKVLHDVTEVALRGAQHVWARMNDPADPLPLGYDGYLKVWALSEPRIPADYILMDEAQDTNPVVLDLLKQQPAQIVYVGDKFQQIYEFRGAINAMEEASAPHTAHLTTSFRFGGEVAWAANRVLSMLGETRPLVGNPDRRSRIIDLTDGTVLARTNATTIAACIEALDAKKRPHLVGGTDELIALLRGVQDLKRDEPSTRPEFFGFENWQQVLEFVRSGEGEELLTFVNLVEARGEAQLLWALNQVVEEDDADLIISTAHKAKGREWDKVRLMDDFLKSLPLKDEKRQPTSQIDPAELRLLYVALTRAKEAMAVPPPLRQFLETGVLPKFTDADRAPRTARPPREQPVGRPSRQQPPVWKPPPNWQTPPPPQTSAPPQGARPTPREPSPSTVTPTPRQRPGFLRRLFGG